MWCSDPFIVSLKKLGYSVVRLPKADIAPLQILTRQGNDLVRLGDLGSLLTAKGSINLPSLSEGPAGNITIRRTGTLSVGIGMALLDGIISAVGGSTVGLGAKYEHAKNTVFEVLDIIQCGVNLAELDQYLEDSDVRPHAKYVAELLESDQLYVTSQTLKSKKFAVEAKQSDDTSVNLNVPEIQAMVGAKVKVSAQSGEGIKLTYEGEVPLVFGFQAIRLFYDQGRYTAFEPAAAKLAMKAIEDNTADGTKPLVTEAPLVRLRVN